MNTQPMDRATWEDAVYTALEGQGMTRSDAQGCAQAGDEDAAYNAGMSPAAFVAKLSGRAVAGCTPDMAAWLDPSGSLQRAGLLVVQSSERE